MSIITISGVDLPDKLTQLHQTPDQIHARGDLELLKRTPIVGIVGARKFTPYGRDVTNDIAQLLARAGVPVVSGLALGVDSVAHRACLEAGGQTIAVLPCGIDTIYPGSHRGLADQILDRGGLIISEYAGKDLPLNYQFIERNRLIAALSDILIIPEAAEKSGSLHTARFALELGKTILAVPGNITSPYSSGTNRLIQTGAIPLLTPQDVLDQLGIKETNKAEYLPENEAETAILTILGDGPVSSNDLLKISELQTSVFQTQLTMLEIKGIVEVSSGQWRLK